MVKRLPETLLPLILVLLPLLAGAQGRGRFSGGMESNSIIYKDGSAGSNNYLKLDYTIGGFSAGLQAEYYPEPLLGYYPELKGIGLPEKYLSWTGEMFSITAGDFYEQFGTGLTLRSWEDRTLGWNNSIGGGKVSFRTRDNVFSAKVIAGVPREYLKYSSNVVAGAEGTLSLGNFFLQASAVNRYHEVSSWSYSVMSGYTLGAVSLQGEYVFKKKGNAQTVEMDYSGGGLSGSLTLRRLENMLDPFGMNYIPALNQQQSYLLASLNPYTPNAAGEAGGVADVFYRKGKWKFHANGSMFYSLPCALTDWEHPRMAYRDFNADVERQWNRKLKTTVFVSIQENSPTHGQKKATNAQNVFVFDGLYKFNSTYSLRAQVQYLFSKELTKDWIAALVELGIAPRWSFHLSDMYNHGDTKEHYYEAGVSFTKSAFRLALSYGHQRAGYICSGGVCRWQPEYTGGMMSLSYNF